MPSTLSPDILEPMNVRIDETVRAAVRTQLDQARLIQEITKTEEDINNGEDKIRHMIRSTTVELSTIMRARAAHSELKTYLKGLRFLTGTQPTRE